ncbi:Pentatricopeptide repeat-containing protein, partial [Nymphaea thermarum]
MDFFHRNGRDPYGFSFSLPHLELRFRARKATIDDLHRLCKKGDMKKVTKVLDQLAKQGIRPNYETCLRILKRCISVNALQEGRSIHSCLMRNAANLDLFLRNTLISMYNKCGGLGHALDVFGRMLERSVVSWTPMISAFAGEGRKGDGLRFRARKATIDDLHRLCKKGDMKKVTKVLDQFAKQGIRPNYETWLRILRRCISINALPEDKSIHSCLMRNAVNIDLFLRNTLISMYIKCGGLGHALDVFGRMPERCVVSWTAMISAFAGEGRKGDGLSDVFVLSSLIGMYAGLGCVDSAIEVFTEMPMRDVVAWNSMIAAYVETAFSREAVELFLVMLVGDIQPNNYSFATVQKACAGLGCVKFGSSVHACLLKMGFDLDVFVMGCVVDMYSKCGNLQEARRTFDNIANRDIVAWNTMINGYLQNGVGEEAIELYCQMPLQGFILNNITYASIFKAVAILVDGVLCKYLHPLVIKSGSLSYVYVGTALVDAYAKSLLVEDAEKVYTEMRYRNLVSWNALITGYSLARKYKVAMNLYCQMQKVPIRPDPYTFIGLLSSCSMSKALDEGSQLHAHSIRIGLDSNVSVGNALLDLYSKCGSVDDASSAFQCIDVPNSISWAAIISAFVHNGGEESAVLYFREMHR